MKVKDLRAVLADLDGEAEFMCLDGPNGGGYPREVCLGPTARTLTERDAEECSDCEGLVGQRVYVIGYGCY